MHYFLNYGRQLTQEEIDSLEEDERAIKKQYPTLDQFKEQINFYEGLHDQLKNIENLKIIQVIKQTRVLISTGAKWFKLSKIHLVAKLEAAKSNDKLRADIYVTKNLNVN